MLSPKNNYIALDFETTGLDQKKDEAIQIGIIKFDHEGNIIKSFQSLIYPEKHIKELKSIVGFITWISYSELETAPKIQELKTKIMSFFDKDSYIIWHNINFDINFLKKYFPDIKYKKWIDTYPLSQNFIHFAPSYALEVLIEFLIQKEENFKDIAQKYKLQQLIDSDNFHNALSDSKAAFALFFFIIKKVTILLEKYPLLKTIIKQHQNIFQEILEKQLFDINIDLKTKKIPALEKQLPPDSKLQIKNGINIKNFDNKKRFYVGNEEFKNLLKKLTTSKNIILAFSSRQKLDIAKHYFQEIGLKNLGFAREEQTINNIVLQSFLQKKTFNEKEIIFLLKYYSHIEKNIWFLDLNNSYDYQIYYFLKDTRKSHNYPIVLTTHGWLFSIINNTESSYYKYNITFFDSEQRYKSYNNYLSRPCDLYHNLQFIETLVYTYTVRNQIKIWKYEKTVKELKQFEGFFQIFMATIFTETNMLFNNININKIEYHPILNNNNFFKTNKIRKKHIKYLDSLKKTLLEEDRKKLKEEIQHIDYILDGLVTIVKRTQNQQWDTYFIFKETNKFTNRDEFTEIFQDRQSLFLSNNKKEYPQLSHDTEQNNKKYELYNIHKINKIIEYIEKIDPTTEKKNIFILSSRKHESKELFDLCYKKNLHNNLNIIAENITGGIWKSIFNIKEKEYNIIIWWYNFLMSIFSKKKAIDIVINFNIKWALEKFFLKDISRYAPEKKIKLDL